MAEIVNLRTARKQAARKADRTDGDQQAAAFGRTKAERKLTKAQAEKAARQLDGHKREPD